MLDPLILKAISIALGTMFVVAALHKLSQGAQFRVTLYEYQLLPDALVPVAARVIPLVELLLGVGWFLSFFQPSLTAAGSALLLAAYTVAIAVNIRRGRVHFDCGCGFAGNNESEQYLSGGLLARNIVLIAAALLTLLPAASRSLGFADYLVLVAALLAGALLFAAANQLLANRGAINTWRKKLD